MLGAFTIEEPSSATILVLRAFFALMIVAFIGFAYSLWASWRDR